MKHVSLHKLIFRLLLPCLLVAGGWLAHGWYYKLADARSKSRRVGMSGYRLISPLLDVELPEGLSVADEPIPFQRTVNAFVQQMIASGSVSSMSVYYRNLLDGPWFDINDKERYNPASMMKVPIMIAWLKRAEKHPEVLKKSFSFDERVYPGEPQLIAPQHALVNGHSYTVEQLLRYMISFSDNKAMWLLYRELGQTEISDVLNNTDVTNDIIDGNNVMTAHGYSGFFRILYNAVYLNRELSQKALELLSHQDFPQGIVAGVPQGVTVASKFGEFVSGTNNHDVQLHEFGIVYHPRYPYIIGIMTRGHDLARQAEVLRTLSALIYAEVDKPKGN